VNRRVLHLSPTHAATIVAAAYARFPAECCGLLEGMATANGWTVTAAHEARNIADEPQRRFLIDPQFQIGLLRRLRGTARSVIGCFHSHPGGTAEPSGTDISAAIEADFVWLIAGGEPTRMVLRAYVFTGDAFQHVELDQSGTE
jgi:desampylase